MSKLLKNIEGFDDVGIGVIHCGEGKGEYVRCSDLEGYDLTDVQIYRYNNVFRQMRPVDEREEDSKTYVFCVKRKDLI